MQVDFGVSCHGPACRGALFALCITATARNARAQSSVDGPRLAARAVSPAVAIKAWNPAGRIRFVGWDKDSVVVYGRVSAPAQFMFAGDANALKLGVDGEWTSADPSRSEFTVYVPKRAKVSAKTVSADIIGTDVGGWFYTVSGSIRLTGHAASVEAESMTGALDLGVVTPWVHARTGDGNLLMRGAPQDVDASTVAGTLSIATSGILRGQFASVTGTIQFAGTPAATAIFEFSDHSGAVDLAMPSTASASLVLSTITGRVDNAFADVRPAAARDRTVHVQLGAGDAQITVRTFKGPIRLRAQ